VEDWPMGVAGPLMSGLECRGMAASIRISAKVMTVPVLQRAVTDCDDSNDKLRD